MAFAKPAPAKQINLFTDTNTPISVADFGSPETYKGLAAFHKYWGKKPTESVSYLIENLASDGEWVMDPFLGSGVDSERISTQKSEIYWYRYKPIFY